MKEIHLMVSRSVRVFFFGPPLLGVDALLVNVPIRLLMADGTLCSFLLVACKAFWVYIKFQFVQKKRYFRFSN